MLTGCWIDWCSQGLPYEQWDLALRNHTSILPAQLIPGDMFERLLVPAVTKICKAINPTVRRSLALTF